MAGKNDVKKIKFPVTVRQAQKLLKDDSIYVYDEEGDKVDVVNFVRRGLKFNYYKTTSELLKELAKLASKDHNQVLISSPDDYEDCDYDEDYVDCDNEVDSLESQESQESENKNSQGGNESNNTNNIESSNVGTDENVNGKGSGCSDQKTLEGDGSESSDCSETGSDSTSESAANSETLQSPQSQTVGTSEWPSSESGKGTATTPVSDIESKTMQESDVQNLRKGEGLVPQNKSELGECQESDNFKPDGQAQSFEDVDGDKTIQGQADNSEDNQEKSLSDDDADWGDSNSDEKLSDDIPQHQKKWGKKFSKAENENPKLSSSANDNHGGINSSLEKAGISPKLSKECQRKLTKLISDASSETSHRRDYQEFCVRVETYRNPNPAKKEESGRPVILIMADVSGSCAGFSNESVLVAKAASKLGVAGSDVIVLSHSNGHPCELEHNGKSVDIDKLIDSKKFDDNSRSSKRKRWNSGKDGFYDKLIQKYNITVAIALGDWDASHYYYQIAVNPNCEKFIWLDNAHCSSRGFVKDETKYALKHFESSGLKINFIRQKLIYKTGCKDAKSFIQEI